MNPQCEKLTNPFSGNLYSHLFANVNIKAIFNKLLEWTSKIRYIKITLSHYVTKRRSSPRNTNGLGSYAIRIYPLSATFSKCDYLEKVMHSGIQCPTLGLHNRSPYPSTFRLQRPSVCLEIRPTLFQMCVFKKYIRQKQLYP